MKIWQEPAKQGSKDTDFKQDIYVYVHKKWTRNTMSFLHSWQGKTQKNNGFMQCFMWETDHWIMVLIIISIKPEDLIIKYFMQFEK